MTEKGLKKEKFGVGQEGINTVETLTDADVVLPAAAWAEKEGTMTNAGRYISHLGKITEAPGEALPDAEIICRFAQKMGFTGFDYKSAAEIFTEHAALTEGTNMDISGLNYAILKEQRAVQWPFTKQTGAFGTARLFTDHQFFTPSKKATIHSSEDANKSEPLTDEHPLIVNTGRIRDQWHTRSKTGKVKKLKQHVKESFLKSKPIKPAERSDKDGV